MSMLKLHHAHRWDLSIPEAKGVQLRLRDFVDRRDRLPEAVTTVAGVDAGLENQRQTIRVAIALLSFPELVTLETLVIRRPVTFPYVPGYLSFREVPAIIDAFQELQTLPDLILCDGQGIAHPRRLGLASHLGVLLDLPTIGVAKSRYIGTHDELPLEKGNYVALMDNDEQIGVVLRTRTNVKPLYISIGHRICLETAIAYVLACTPKYRLPETTRLADHLASHAQNI